MNHGVGGTTHRHHHHERVLERLTREDVERLEVALEEHRVRAGGSLATPVDIGDPAARGTLQVEINGVQKHILLEHGLDPAVTDNRIIGAALGQALASVKGSAIVVTQLGHVNTGAFDPLAEIVPLARAAKAWVHVDGAFGLWARTSKVHAPLAEGVELADSWAVDGHKWLQTPYDSGFAIVRDREAHRRAMMVAASYLPSVGAGERDPSHFVPELSRRARGFPAWAMIRHLGRAGIAEIVERNCRQARLIAETVSAEPGIAVLNDVVLNQLILRFGDDDKRTLGTIDRLQQDGVAFAGGAK
mgnify:CR=1 FL=1